jgi:hypothetical protein
VIGKTLTNKKSRSETNKLEESSAVSVLNPMPILEGPLDIDTRSGRTFSNEGGVHKGRGDI